MLKGYGKQLEEIPTGQSWYNLSIKVNNESNGL